MQCGLMHLPLELRQEIYGYILNHHRPTPILTVVIDTQFTHNGAFQYAREPDAVLYPAILRINKQIYSEAIPLLYAGCVFNPAADEQLITEFFGRMSEHARSHVLRLKLRPRRSAGRSVPGPRPNIPQIQVVPVWGPVCDTVAALLPALREVSIQPAALNLFELKAGHDVSWIFAPLSGIRGIKKTLLVRPDTRMKDEEWAMLEDRWEKLVEKADQDMEEYTSGIARVRENQSGWPRSHWRTKRIMSRMGMSS